MFMLLKSACTATGALPLLLLADLAGSTITSSTYIKFKMAQESRYRQLCPPVVIPLRTELRMSSTIFCFDYCLLEPSCIIFSTDSVNCSLWTFDFDPNYEAGDFSPPFTDAHWVIRDAIPPPRDMALGKSLTSGGTFTGYSNASMLTGGSNCFKNKETDCYCTPNTYNYVTLDLGTSMAIKKIIITGPGFDDVAYFKSVVIRVGNKGDSTDPILGTSTSTPPSFKRFQYSVSASSIRYVRLKDENSGSAICLCKIQAYM